MNNIDHHDAITERVRKLEHRQLPTSGEYASGVTKTVGASGRDYTTIQAALNFFMGKNTYNCKIAVDAGTYNENITIRSDVTIEGDTRTLVGLSYVSGAAGNRANLTNGGAGNVTLSNSGSNLTVSMSTTQPDFDAAGFVSGDKVYVLNSSLAWSLMTISSVLNNVITFTGTAPTVGAVGSAIVFCPNRWIVASSGNVVAVRNACALSGFTIQQSDTNATSACIDVAHQEAYAYVAKIATLGGRMGVNCFRSTTGIYGSTQPVTHCSAGIGASKSWSGVFAYGANYYIDHAILIGHDKTYHVGFEVYYGSNFICSSLGIMANFQYGMYANGGAVGIASSEAAINCVYGFYATRNSFIYAGSTDAYDVGCTTTWSPTTSDVEGNADSIVTHS